MLSRYINEDQILLNLEASDYKTVLKKMLTMSQRKDRQQAMNEIIKRESLMSTALGKGIALPRAVLSDDIRTEIIIGLSRPGLVWETLDRLSVQIIFLSLFSARDNRPLIIAQTLRLLNDHNLRRELLNAKSTSAVIEAIRSWEKQ
jgi:PTS system nitrogen regulatory IIA component